MRIGVVTFHCAPSYGAFFQAYALAKYLQGLGHTAEIIDYMPAHRLNAFRQRERFHARRYGLNRANLRWLKDASRVRYYLSRRNVFREAVKTDLPVSRVCYRTLEDLQNNPPSCDVCFFGSDQIWNCDKTGGRYDPAYFGAFGPSRMRRVAYAASFGKDEAPDYDNQLGGLLEQLDLIGVRESSAVDVVARYSRASARKVLDPTFLLGADEYPPPIPRRDQPFVLGYLIGKGGVPRRVLQHIGQHFGLPIVEYPGPIGVFSRYPSPLEMLSALRRARYVVTNSFHGLALSLIHHVPFTSVGLDGPLGALNVRVTDLLDQTGLGERFVQPATRQYPGALVLSDPDWGDVDRRIDNMRCDSKAFIQEALALRAIT